jgi:hypothetical protein
MKRITTISVAVLLFVTVGGFVVWGISRARQSAVLTQCQTNL